MGTGSATCSRAQLYRHLLAIWVGVDAGYVLELRVGDRIFLKASHVEDTLQFDRNLHANSKDSIPHLRHNLPGERRYVREKLKEVGLGIVTGSTPPSTDDSEGEDRIIAMKKTPGRCSLSYGNREHQARNSAQGRCQTLPAGTADVFLVIWTPETSRYLLC